MCIKLNMKKYLVIFFHIVHLLSIIHESKPSGELILNQVNDLLAYELTEETCEELPLEIANNEITFICTVLNKTKQFKETEAELLHSVRQMKDLAEWQKLKPGMLDTYSYAQKRIISSHNRQNICPDTTRSHIVNADKDFVQFMKHANCYPKTKTDFNIDQRLMQAFAPFLTTLEKQRDCGYLSEEDARKACHQSVSKSQSKFNLENVLNEIENELSEYKNDYPERCVAYAKAYLQDQTVIDLEPYPLCNPNARPILTQ